MWYWFTYSALCVNLVDKVSGTIQLSCDSAWMKCLKEKLMDYSGACFARCRSSEADQDIENRLADEDAMIAKHAAIAAGIFKNERRIEMSMDSYKPPYCEPHEEPEPRGSKYQNFHIQT